MPRGGYGGTERGGLPPGVDATGACPPGRGSQRMMETDLSILAGDYGQEQQPLAYRPAPPARTTSAPSVPVASTSRPRRPEGRPPRPMNAWLLFRTAQLKLMQHESPEGLRKSQGELSKLIAEKWRNVDAEVRVTVDWHAGPGLACRYVEI